MARAAARPLNAARRYAAAVRARRTLRSFETDDAEAALSFARSFGWYGDRISPTQATEEILPLLRRLQHEPPRTVLEIGTDLGGTLFLWSRVAARDALLVSVDMRPLGPLGQHGPYALTRRAFAQQEQRVEIVMPADSHADATRARIERILGGRPVDFLFIDGDHTYEGVKADFERFSPLVRPGGLVALHDIAATEAAGVIRYWEELRTARATEELVATTEFAYGIGLVVMP